MQYDVSTPDEYLRALDDDWRRDTLMHLRDLIKREAPELSERIKYRKSVTVAATKIDAFIARAVAVRRQGGDVC